MNLQKFIFEKVRGLFPDNSEWSQKIADTLKISRVSVYRREREEVPLIAEEIELLCREYSINLDEFLLSGPQTIMFRYTSLNMTKMDNYVHYIHSLLAHLEQIVKSEDKEILFCADDIPIFHFMAFPELTYFKLYTWNQSVMDLGIPFEEFVYEIKKLRIDDLFNRLHSLYVKIPSREIWSGLTLMRFLELLEYYESIGSFQAKSSVDTLMIQLRALLDNLKNWTLSQEKHLGISFELYSSPLDLGLSQMLCRQEGQNSVLIKLYTINSIATYDERYVRETSDWIKALLKKSICLSLSAEKERVNFFRKMESDIQSLSQQIGH